MAVNIPYPIPDPATGEFDPFAIKRNFEFLASRIDSAVSQNQATVLFRENGNPYSNTVSTAAETTIFSMTIPQDVFSTFRAITAHVVGDYLNDTGLGDAFKVRVRYGAQSITFDLDDYTASSTRYPWWATLFIASRGAEDVQVATGVFNTKSGAGVSGGSGDLKAKYTMDNAWDVDSGSPQTFAITIQNDTSSADESCRVFYLLGVLT